MPWVTACRDVIDAGTCVRPRCVTADQPIAQDRILHANSPGRAADAPARVGRAHASGHRRPRRATFPYLVDLERLIRSAISSTRASGPWPDGRLHGRPEGVNESGGLIVAYTRKHRSGGSWRLRQHSASLWSSNPPTTDPDHVHRPRRASTDASCLHRPACGPLSTVAARHRCWILIVLVLHHLTRSVNTLRYCHDQPDYLYLLG